MPHPFSTRQLLLGGIALLLAGLLAARWISNRGLVTIHAKDLPVGGVIASIARQGHVRLESSLDPSKTVSMDVERVSVAEAVDVLALNADASWRVVYLAAPTKSALEGALATLKGSGTLEDWSTHYYPTPAYAALGSEAVDPRLLSLRLEGVPASQPDLSALLDEAAQKSGVMTASPKDWSPAVKNLPGTARVGKAIPALVKGARGNVSEFFLLAQRNRRGGGAWSEGGEGSESRPATEQGWRGGGMPTLNPEWAAQRQKARIQLLPASEQAEASREAEERGALFTKLMSLPPEERGAKMRELASGSGFFERMADQRILRDAKMSPQQRIQRSLSYLERKAAQQSPATSPPPPSR